MYGRHRQLHCEVLSLPEHQSIQSGTGSSPSVSLRRSLTLTHATLYGLGVTVGAGIYVLIGVVAARSGMHAPLAFVIAALLMGTSAASFAELGSRMPVSAGEAAYARAAFASEWISLFVGLLVVAIATVSAAAISVGSAGYIRVFVDMPSTMIIAAVVLLMGGIAARGIVQSVTFAGAMTLIEVGGLIFIVLAGFWSGPEMATRIPEIVPPIADTSAYFGIAGASLLAVFAFIGFEGLVNVAEEMEDPKRTLPRAILLTLVITTVLYVLVIWVALVSIGPEVLAESAAPLALVFQRVTGLSPATMSAVAIVATLNGIIVQIIMSSRVLYGLSTQRSLPSALSRISPRTHTPINATIVTVSMVLAFALLLPLEYLADWTSRLTIVLFAIVNLALMRIKARETTPPAGIYLAPKWLPGTAFVCCIVLLAMDVVRLVLPFITLSPLH
jgi:basic amino acid/polyamine antiporter, APA family